MTDMWTAIQRLMARGLGPECAYPERAKAAVNAAMDEEERRATAP